MHNQQAALYSQHTEGDIYSPDDRKRIVDNRICHWRRSPALEEKLTISCTLVLQQVNKAKGVLSLIGTLLMPDASQQETLLQILNGAGGAVEDGTGGRRSRNEYGACKIGPYMTMWSHIETICNDSVQLAAFLKCHLQAVARKNEMLREQLVAEGKVSNYAESEGHRALEVNERMHTYLEAYFNHLRYLKGKGVEKGLLTRYCASLHACIGRVVSRTPEPYLRAAPVSVACRVLRQCEMLQENKFETPSTAELLGPALGLANTAGLKAIEERTRQLEKMMIETAALVKKARPTAGRTDTAGDKAKKPGGAEGQGSDAGLSAKAKVTKNQERARINRTIEGMVATLKAQGKALTPEEIRKLRKDMYDRADETGRRGGS